jgi:hypothetical protein
MIVFAARRKRDHRPSYEDKGKAGPFPKSGTPCLFFNVLNRLSSRAKTDGVQSRLRERVDLKKMMPCADLMF